jgi:hypothetical protein
MVPLLRWMAALCTAATVDGSTVRTVVGVRQSQSGLIELERLFWAVRELVSCTCTGTPSDPPPLSLSLSRARAAG